MPPNKAPIDAVGGPQNEGPWPEDVDEIVEGNSYRRPVVLADGSVQELEVTVTNITRHGLREDPSEDGYSVSIQFDDPTADGGVL